MKEVGGDTAFITQMGFLKPSLLFGMLRNRMLQRENADQWVSETRKGLLNGDGCRSRVMEMFWN